MNEEALDTSVRQFRRLPTRPRLRGRVGRGGGAAFGGAHGIVSRQAADDATAPNTPPCILIILIAAA
jgi:hypothetical protein